MYLKRLEIQGFKSFADRTVLDFLPPASGRFSVTAIVGPNGAGKSNIVDTIRWVMGEQKVKILRGKKSEDIIFSGSDSRGKLGMAEVTMVLDNGDKRVMPDYSEISITRRLYRSGEGEYLLNGIPSRLFDVRLILAQAQFAEGSYGIIGQGMIDRLLLAPPAERKDFFDEASGIKEFQLKRHRAALKLNRARQNMEQAEVLLAEVSPRLKLLSRQIKKLEKRQAVEIELRETQELYYSSLFSRNQKELDDFAEQLRVEDARYAERATELTRVQNELAELAGAESRREVFVKLQREYTDHQHTLNELEKKMAVLTGQSETEYSRRGRQDIAWLQNKLREVEYKLSKTADEEQSARSAAVKAEKEINEQNITYDKLTAEKTEIMVDISRWQEKLAESRNWETSMQVLGLAPARAVLANKDKFGGRVFGTVAELGEVMEEYAVALDTAAGSQLSALVVEDDETARQAIDYLRRERLGRATFLPLNKIKPREARPNDEELLAHPDVLGAALDFIKFKSRFSDIFSFVLGNTLVVRDLAAAQRVGIGRARMVTLDGDLVERQGVMKGGWRHFKEQKLSFSAGGAIFGGMDETEARARLTRAEKDFADRQSLSEKIKERVYQLEIEKQSFLNRVEILSADIKNTESERAGLVKELALNEMSPEEYGQELARINEEKNKLVAEIDSAREQLTAVSEKIGEFNEEEEKKKQRVFELQDMNQVAQTILNEVSDKRQELRIAIAKLETRQETLNEEAVNDLGTSAAAIGERVARVLSAEELTVAGEAIQKLKYQLSLIGGIDEEVAGEYQETKERHDFLFDQLADLKSATTELEKVIVDLDNLMKSKRATAFKQIKKEFNRYFKILFDGGRAELYEVYEDELAETSDEEIVGEVAEESVAEEKNVFGKKRQKILAGIEVLANPPGKKIKSLSALSGGERTLTSIALICAILNCNPSPFVVMDEVEAALDEVNTQRFTKILSELAKSSQFIVITHNRVTMHAADALYGVTMPTSGVSRLVSVKLGEETE